MSECRVCEASYSPTAHQIAKRDFICRPCARAAEKAWRERRKAQGRAVVSARMPAEYHAAYATTYRARPDVLSRRAELARLRARNPAERPRIEARWKVRRAIESGKLTPQPCEVCRAEKAEAHHDDYSKPLDVRWLCRPHHREHHAKARGES